MNRKMKFLWIDDNPDRRQNAETMQAQMMVHVEFYDARNTDLTEIIQDIMDTREPDLIIVDHKLEDANSGIFRTGTSIATVIREKWPSCPIVCVTAVDKDDVDFQKRSLYQEIFPYHEINKKHQDILSIAEGFNKIQKVYEDRSQQLITLLKATQDDEEKINQILPYELMTEQIDQSTAPIFARWVRDVLMTRPGFLYNKLWIATLLGIKESSFYKIEKILKPALYSGVFSTPNNPLWWKSKVITIVFNRTVKTNGLLYAKGRSLRGIVPDDYSVCYVDDKSVPDTVAYIDASSNAASHPMALKNTIHHSGYPNLLFFEEIRMIKPAE